MNAEVDQVTPSIEAVRGEVAKFDQIEAGIAEIERQHPKNLVLDVTNAAGMQQAIAARRAYREPRLACERARKAAKAPVLELGRRIDQFAGRLEERLRIGEDHFDAQIQAEEARKEAERERRRQEEAERIAAARRHIAEVFAAPLATMPRRSVVVLRSMRDRAELEACTAERFGDLLLEAQEARDALLLWFDREIQEQVEREAEAEEKARERAERARQDAEAERSRAEERERAAAAAALLAEKEREVAERERKVAEKEAEQHRVAEAERQAALDAAQQRVNAAAARERAIADAAPAMLQLLFDWRSAEHVNPSLLEQMLGLKSIRERRDIILFDLSPTNESTPA